MSEKASIANRLRDLMRAENMGENELARRAKVPQPTIHRILSGESKSPRINNLEKIGKALGTTASYLSYGEDSTASLSTPRGKGIPFGPGMAAHAGFGKGFYDALKQPISSAKRDHRLLSAHGYSYPIIDWSAINGHEALIAATSAPPESTELSKYAACGQGFWLRVKGDAMSAPVGNAPSLPPDTLVLFDTGLTDSLCKVVLSSLSMSREPVMRRLIEDGGKRYLQALNPSYPLILLENTSQILAIAVESKAYL
ncbi:helix-turn-helix domain-containing protein [Salinicola halophyticus]|uniref:helix-turn-helix domain-containing protein n=1 Tax=Salinicola halophyticus TaxID=1808881 RepID=UPI003F48A942